MYVIIGDELCKRGFNHLLLRCLDKHEANLNKAEVHLGVCENHKAGVKIKALILRHSHYWMTMGDNCVKFARGWREYKWDGPIQHALAKELHPVLNP